MGEDITKTGPVGLKGLNRQGNNTISKEEYEKFISSYRSPESIRDSIKQSHASRMGQQYSLHSGMGDLGDSIYDNDIYNLDELNRVQYIRGENQPGLVQLINGIAKGAGLAATTFIDGTAGFVVGLGTGIYNKFDEDPNTGFISGMWDNPVTRAMQSINEWAEEALPNYYTEDELNKHWSKNIFTANFIGDKLIKNLGFAVGALYSGKAITSLPKLIGAAKLASKVPAGVASLAGSTVSAINEGSIEAINSTKEWYDSNKAVLDNSYNQAIQNIEKYKGTTLYDVLLKKETDAYNNTLAKLSEDRVKLGNSILGLNLPILLASNIFQFGKAYSKGYKAAKTATSITGKLGNYATNKTVTKGILKGLSNALTEGTEEVSQKAAAEIAGVHYGNDLVNFHKAQMDPDAEQEVVSWINSTIEGLGKTFNDPNTWEEFFIGALTGALGIPTFRSFRNNNGEFQSPIKIEGGFKNELKDYLKQKEEEEELVEYMNNVANSPDFLNYYRGLIRHNTFEREKDRAILEGSEFDYENAEFAQMMSDVIMFDKAGKLNDLTTIIKESVSDNLTDEELESIVNNTTTFDEETGIYNGPFVDIFGNPQYSTEEGKKEMIESLRYNKKRLLRYINFFIKNKDAIISQYGDVFTKDQLEELSYLATMSDHWNHRAVSLARQVSYGLQEVAEQYGEDKHFSISPKDFIESKLKENEVRVYIKDKKLYRTTERITKEVLEELESIATNEFKPVTETDSYIKYVETELNNAKKLLDDSKLFERKLKEYLENPSKLSEDNKKAEDEAKKTYKKKATKDLRKKLKDTTTPQEVEQVLNEDESSEEDKKEVLKDLEEEGVSSVTSHNNIEPYYEDVSIALATTGEEFGVQLDAKRLLDKQKSISKTIMDIANPNSIVLNDDSFFLGEDDDLQNAQTRFYNAQYALRRAMHKVNNSREFSSIFTNDEYRKPPVKVFNSVGVTEETTGDSGTSTTPVTNPSNISNVNTPEDVSIPIGEISASELVAENSTINEQTEDPYTFDNNNKGKRLYYRPAIPEIHITASRSRDGKPGDFRPFNVVVSERESNINFDSIYNYLKDNGAFTYVNEGNLKPGDELEFMIDPTFEESVKEESWHKEPVIFIIDKRNKQIVGSLDSSSSKASNTTTGLLELKAKILNEYNQNSTTERFIATPTTRVSQIMIGKVPIDNVERNLSSVNNIREGKGPLFGIVKKGVLTTNTLNDADVIKPLDIGGKEGRMYLLIPNAAGKYSPMAVRIKHFNKTEFDIYSVTLDNSPKARMLRESIASMSEVTNKEELNAAVEKLSAHLYTGNLYFDWFNSERGYTGIYITKVEKDSLGREIYTDELTPDGKRKRKEIRKPVYFSNPNILYDPSSIEEGIAKVLMELNLPIQIDISSINKGNTNKMLLDSDVLTSNITDARVISSWFTTDYIDSNGNIQPAVNPVKVQPTTPDSVETPVGGKESAVPGVPVEVGSYSVKVDVETKTFYDRNGVNITKQLPKETKMIMLSIAWADITYGDKTESDRMHDNKVITPNGKVFNRTTKKYLDDKEAQDIIDIIEGRKNPRSSQEYSKLPIFNKPNNSSIKIEDKVDDYNKFEEGGQIGYYQIGDTVYRGYIKELGKINGIPVFVTKLRDRGYGKPGEVGMYTVYLPVFQNGLALNLRGGFTSDKEGMDAVLEKLKGNPSRVVEESNKKTLLSTKKDSTNENKGLDLLVDTSKLNTKPNIISQIQDTNDSNSEFEDDFNPLMRKVDSTRQLWNKDKELEWLNRVLPQLSKENRVKIVEGLIQVSNNGPVAWGLFDKNIMVLSDIAAEGTTYHEAFHVVFNLLLDNNDRKSLLNEYKKNNPTMSEIELEELMAEDFREFVTNGGKDTRTLGRKILDFFKSLFIKTKYWSNFRPSSRYYFQAINEGKYSNNYLLTNDSVSRTRLENYTKELQQIKDQAIANGTFDIKWETLDNEDAELLTKKGWTKEKFNSVSQKERDKALECATL